MSELLKDDLNLDLLESICSGEGVEVNINALSKTFKRHRNTIKDQVNALFENKIIDKPIYPFMWLYKEYSLLVLTQSDLPRNEAIDKWLREDENIFAGFYVRDEEYNTMLIEFHADLYSHAQWKKRIVSEKKIPPRDLRYPANTLFFSTGQILKYQPHSPIYTMEEVYAAGKTIEINGYKMNPLCFQILKSLMLGEGIRTNENLLATKLDVHRRTIERRIQAMIDEKIISKPICRFPKFFVPPNQILVVSIIEIKKSKENIFKAIRTDPHIPLAVEASVGRYNLLLFGVFSNVEDHFEWEEKYDARFPESIGAMKNLYLSPKKMASIDQQKVSLNIIKRRKEIIHGRRLMDTITNPQV